MTVAPGLRPASTTLAMLLADSRLPAGAHVSSNALEAALLAGLSPADVGAYMSDRLHTVVTIEAGTAVVARRLLEGSVRPHRAGLEELGREWAARTPGAAQREISRELGDGLLRLAGVLWPEVVALVPTGSPRPLVLGVIAARTGLDPADLVRLIVYDDAQTIAAALLKLEPSDPRRAVALVLETCRRGETLLPALAAVHTAAEIPQGSAPLTEEWAQAQSVLPRRLFRA